MVITVRNKDVDILNSSIRSLLKANGTLQGTEYSVQLLEGKSPIWQEIESYFNKDKDLQIQNSEFATLTSVSKK
ncbi:putative conjugative transfer protein TraA [Orientia tsutsugamushi str. Gilliam]|uniref:Putative conjugative transfer protein TraA n=1 Tax=Orientia tsutsugamushi str. Gilliam TaxID=1359184 RepID=A0A0F3M5X7_ORITS|nr:hypothetical protein [Orientia tsutsugamushi]KJV50897.1 putative conjugative transfer protein TraA [Orientia tsutsugamushi str. Gilliam]